MSGISLQSLLTPEKVVTVDYPGYEGFKLTIAFLSREEVVKIRKRCYTTTFDKRSRQPVEKFDDEMFLKLYIAAVVKGWTGLKFKYLEEFIPVDLSTVKDVEAELEFNAENALLLMKNSSELDGFVTDLTSDLTNFTKYSSVN